MNQNSKQMQQKQITQQEQKERHGSCRKGNNIMNSERWWQVPSKNRIRIS